MAVKAVDAFQIVQSTVQCDNVPSACLTTEQGQRTNSNYRLGNSAQHNKTKSQHMLGAVVMAEAVIFYGG